MIRRADVVDREEEDRSHSRVGATERHQNVKNDSPCTPFSVRSQVRKLQREPRLSVHDLSQGTIEALEAVAATAISKRASPEYGDRSSTTNSASISHAKERAASSDNSSPDEAPSSLIVVPTPVSPSKLPDRRRLRRGMAALGVAAGGSTSSSRRWSSSNRSASGNIGRDGDSGEAYRHDVSSRSIFRMASSDMIPRARTSFASSPRPPGPAAAANSTSNGLISAEISSSGSGSPNIAEPLDLPTADTLPRTGRVRAAAQALAAAQSAGSRYNSSRSPPIFRSISIEGSSNNAVTGSGSASNNSDGASSRRQKSRGWWIKPTSDKEKEHHHGGEFTESSGDAAKVKPAVVGVRAENVELRAENVELRAERREIEETKRAGDAARAENVLLRSENYQLRAEGRLLEEAVRAAQGKVTALESMSQEVSNQAASTVRRAEAKRIQAEEAARKAESRCYSLSATVQVLQSAADVGSGDRKGSEAEVTTAYQRILQDMDMERAALQEKLTSARRENDKLRTQLLRAKASSNPQLEVEANGTCTDASVDQESPRLKQFSFLRPRARGHSASFQPEPHLIAGNCGVGMVNSVAGGMGRGVGVGERQNGFFKSSRGRGGGILFSALGRRVRLVHLEGLNVLAAGGDTSEGHLKEQEKQWTWTPETSLPSADAPSPSRRYCPEFPWSKEWARWYGHVSLVVTPGAPTGSMPDVADPPVHAMLLTDTALYVTETRSGATGCDMLCRLESHRVESLSLPLETRPLPNGDEVAVRSNAVVLRLKFLQGSSATTNGLDQSPPRPVQAQGTEDALGGGDGPVAARGGRRGFLWLSCTTNEARGELVERLCQWHQTNHKLRKQQQLQRRRSATVTGEGSESPVPLGRGTDDEDDFGGRGRMAYDRGAGVGGGGDAGLEDDGILEVDQVLAKELLDDLKEERSINVTALLLADEEMLGL